MSLKLRIELWLGWRRHFARAWRLETQRRFLVWGWRRAGGVAYRFQQALAAFDDQHGARADADEPLDPVTICEACGLEIPQ